MAPSPMERAIGPPAGSLIWRRAAQAATTSAVNRLTSALRPVARQRELRRCAEDKLGDRVRLANAIAHLADRGGHLPRADGGLRHVVRHVLGGVSRLSKAFAMDDAIELRAPVVAPIFRLAAAAS